MYFYSNYKNHTHLLLYYYVVTLVSYYSREDTYYTLNDYLLNQSYLKKKNMARNQTLYFFLITTANRGSYLIC